MSRFIETKIDGYNISLDPDMDGASLGEPRVTGCWIELRQSGQTYLGSLELLTQVGELECDRTGRQHRVDIPVVEKIAAWALSNGY